MVNDDGRVESIGDFYFMRNVLRSRLDTSGNAEVTRLYKAFEAAEALESEVGARDDTTALMNNAVADIADIQSTCVDDMLMKARMLKGFSEPPDTDALSSLVHSLCDDLINILAGQDENTPK